MDQTATIISILRNFNGNPNIVSIVTSSDLALITTEGFLTGEEDNIETLNNGPFQWNVTDIVLIAYATEFLSANFIVNWFIYDPTNMTFIALPSIGADNSLLQSGHITVGNSLNIGESVALSGDATLSNTGIITIGAGAVTGSKIANNAVDFAQLAADVSSVTVTTLTSAQLNALFTTSIQLVPAPASGTVLIFDKVVIDYHWSTAVTAGGGPIAVQYSSAANGAGIAASASIAAATLNGLSAPALLTAGSVAVAAIDTSLEAIGLYLGCATGVFTGGGGGATVYTYYKTLAPV
jgi:hypothetical protein